MNVDMERFLVAVVLGALGAGSMVAIVIIPDVITMGIVLGIMVAGILVTAAIAVARKTY